MKKILFAVLATAALFAAPVHAQTTETTEELRSEFFTKKLDNDWGVFGYKFTKSKTQMNNSCVAESQWKDGSYFQMWIDLVDSEFWMTMTNVSWNFAENKNRQEVRINMYKGKNFIDGGDFSFYTSTKNRIAIPQVKREAFMKAMVKSDRLVMVMPGDAANVTVGWGPQANRILATLKSCLDEYRSGVAEIPDFNVKPVAKPTGNERDRL